MGTKTVIIVTCDNPLCQKEINTNHKHISISGKAEIQENYFGGSTGVVLESGMVFCDWKCLKQFLDEM
jgi:hypothetical protein